MLRIKELSVVTPTMSIVADDGVTRTTIQPGQRGTVVHSYPDRLTPHAVIVEWHERLISYVYEFMLLVIDEPPETTKKQETDNPAAEHVLIQNSVIDASFEVLTGSKQVPPKNLEFDTNSIYPCPVVMSTTPFKQAYYCENCNAWVVSTPRMRMVDTIGVLSGRKGYEFYCCRCGHEIGFSGYVS